MTQSSAYALAGSAVFFALGYGMIHVTWINPRSRLRPVCCARWKLFGRVASNFGALTQSLTLLSVGLASLLTALHSPFVKAALVLVGVSFLATGIARLADLRDDEI